MRVNVSILVRIPYWLSASLLFIALADPAGAATYEVGPARTYATLGSVPWKSLLPGDVVNVYPKAGNAPYYEKLSLSRSGTALAPITIHGVPDASGNRPILDGTNAVQNNDSVYNNDRGLIITGNGGDATGQYWVIENLELRNASSGGVFYPGTTPDNYADNAAGVFLQGGKSAVIRNCWIHDNMNGIQTGGKSLGVTNVLLEACRIENNGAVGSSQQHNVYHGAEPITVQYCYLGGLKPGADGQNFKDRGSGTIFRYNWIEGGPNDQLDLVDGGTVPANAYVYGNVIVKNNQSGNGRMALFGADGSGNRAGTLYFVNNTVVTTRSLTYVFQVTSGNTVQAYNNIIYYPGGGNYPQINGGSGGTVLGGYNWISPGSNVTTGPTTLTNTISPAGNNPFFVNYAAKDYHLAASSACINAGALTWPGQASTTAVRQYVVERQSEVRPVDSHIDIGAYENVVYVVGDINHDGYVNVGDLQALVAAWGSNNSGAFWNWDPNADLNNDGFVNVGDLQLLVANWGR